MTDPEIWENYKFMKEMGAEKRANNRKNSAELLKAFRIPFVSKNAGAHLIVTSANHTIDFWPGTGKFIVRGGKTGRGVKNLIAFYNRDVS